MYYSEGFYLSRVVDQGFQRTKETGKPMIVLRVQPVARLRTAEDGSEYEETLNGQPYERNIYLVIEDDGEKQDKLLKKLRFNGFEGDSFSQLNLVGREIRTACFPQRDDANKEDWKLVGPRATNESRPLDAISNTAAMELDALFGRKLKPVPSAPDRREVVPRKPEHAASYEAQRPPEEKERSGVHVSSSSASEVPF